MVTEVELVGKRPQPYPCQRQNQIAAAQQLYGHQRLVDVVHAHAPGDGVAQALVGGGELPCEVAYDGKRFRCDGGHEPAGSSKPC